MTLNGHVLTPLLRMGYHNEIFFDPGLRLPSGWLEDLNQPLLDPQECHIGYAATFPTAWPAVNPNMNRTQHLPARPHRRSGPILPQGISLPLAGVALQLPIYDAHGRHQCFSGPGRPRGCQRPLSRGR
jgi:hypothetical protein